jgi:hypothetical protein
LWRQWLAKADASAALRPEAPWLASLAMPQTTPDSTLADPRRVHGARTRHIWRRHNSRIRLLGCGKLLPSDTPSPLKHLEGIVVWKLGSGHISNRDFDCELHCCDPSRSIRPVFEVRRMANMLLEALRGCAGGPHGLWPGLRNPYTLRRNRASEDPSELITRSSFSVGRYDCLPFVHRWFAEPSAAVINL